MSTNKPLSQVPPVERTEQIWLYAAILLGSILRLSFPSRIAIEHFDEAVYASNFWFGGNPYPAQHLYSPPLLPAAIEWTMMITSLLGIRPTGCIPMIPCLITGIATIPSMWWVCRRWFGPTAGLVSAWLVATSDFHICYSRSALTDVPVILFMLWAVYFIAQAFAKIELSPQLTTRRGKPEPQSSSSLPVKQILFAGGFTGLAWWTKYNGWLPLAIGAAGGALWQMTCPASERKPQRIAACWISIATIAGVVWSPVLWSLQDAKIGGYAAVAANHRQYVVGFQGWENSAWRQINNLGTYENPLDILFYPTHVSPNLIEPKSFWSTCSTAWTMLTQFAQWKIGFAIVRQFLQISITPLVFPLVAGVFSMLICLKTALFPKKPAQLIPACLLAAWLAGMTFATPFYHPYPRLVLPWLCAVWICLGLLVQSYQYEPVAGQCSRFSHRCWLLLFVTFGLISVLRTVNGYAYAWVSRTGIQSACEQMATALKDYGQQEGVSESEPVICVLAEPAVVFGLNAGTKAVVVPVPDLSFLQNPLPKPTFLVVSEDRDSQLSETDREILKSCPRRVLERLYPARSHLVVRDSEKVNQGDPDLTFFRIRP